MFEKVNPAHPDKVADRIAGALVDLAYKQDNNPRIAVEVLIGHGVCHIIAETSISLDKADVGRAVHRIAGDVMVDYREVPQDAALAENQSGGLRCGDNGIFRGVPMTREQSRLSALAKELYKRFPSDGKYILDEKDSDRLIVCQSRAGTLCIVDFLSSSGWNSSVVNPLGDWSGGLDVDTGATNRKLGSDMGDSMTGGGLHGKDLSKADVSMNIYAFCMAQLLGHPVEFCCAIGDSDIDGIPYNWIVDFARKYIDEIGGFEKFAEWGLI